MSIVERVKELGLPLDQVVVIGSGILDALELRPARDIDLVVTPGLFAQLHSTGRYQASVVRGEMVLQRDDQEIWQSWGSGAVPNFGALYSEGVTYRGVRFAHPRFVLAQKRQRDTPKDQRDIALLETYLAS